MHPFEDLSEPDLQVAVERLRQLLLRDEQRLPELQAQIPPMRQRHGDMLAEAGRLEAALVPALKATLQTGELGVTWDHYWESKHPEVRALLGQHELLLKDAATFEREIFALEAERDVLLGYTGLSMRRAQLNDATAVLERKRAERLATNAAVGDADRASLVDIAGRLFGRT